MTDRVIWFADLDRSDVGRVGGKNASLGEMIRYLAGAGIRVPDGFATTADAYWEFLELNELREKIARQATRLREGADLESVGRSVREHFLAATLPRTFADDIVAAYRELAERLGRPDPEVAVRSSATAEDLPQASFAGQQETFLNVRGVDALLDACRRCYASLRVPSSRWPPSTPPGKATGSAPSSKQARQWPRWPAGRKSGATRRCGTTSPRAGRSLQPGRTWLGRPSGLRSLTRTSPTPGTPPRERAGSLT